MNKHVNIQLCRPSALTTAGKASQSNLKLSFHILIQIAWHNSLAETNNVNKAAWDWHQSELLQKLFCFTNINSLARSRIFHNMGFEIFILVDINIAVLWDVTLGSVLDGYQCSEGTCSFLWRQKMDCGLLGCDTSSLGEWFPTFRRNIWPYLQGSRGPSRLWHHVMLQGYVGQVWWLLGGWNSW